MSIIQAIGQIVSKRNRPFALTRQNIDIGEDAAYEAVLGAPVTLFQKLVSNTSVSGSQGVVSGHIMEEKGTSATITGWDTEDSSKVATILGSKPGISADPTVGDCLEYRIIFCQAHSV